MKPSLKAEIKFRLSQGDEWLSVRAMGERFKALGYSLDRSLDCRSMSRYMTGSEAGRSYPACTTGVREIDSGLSAFNFAARRDANFRAMQKLRYDVFAVSRGAILEA